MESKACSREGWRSKGPKLGSAAAIVCSVDGMTLKRIIIKRWSHYYGQLSLSFAKDEDR
jgi:hypothetical protein